MDIYSVASIVGIALTIIMFVAFVVFMAVVATMPSEPSTPDPDTWHGPPTIIYVGQIPLIIPGAIHHRDKKEK
jgi:quinol-cytochrome oxidoreductase complex cytochrome b subunit